VEDELDPAALVKVTYIPHVDLGFIEVGGRDEPKIFGSIWSRQHLSLRQ
jgi:hypothetical protein